MFENIWLYGVLIEEPLDVVICWLAAKLMFKGQHFEETVVSLSCKNVIDFSYNCYLEVAME